MSIDLRIERMIDASPSESYEAFTDPDAMRAWYQVDPDWDVEISECDVRVGGRTVITFGSPSERFVEVMAYTVVEPAQRLVYDEHFEKPDGTKFDTEVTVTFEAQGEKTLLTIVQTGFADVQERDAHQGGWPSFLDRLAAEAVARKTAV